MKAIRRASAAMKKSYVGGPSHVQVIIEPLPEGDEDEVASPVAGQGGAHRPSRDRGRHRLLLVVFALAWLIAISYLTTDDSTRFLVGVLGLCLLGVLDGIGSVDNVASNVDAKVTTNGSRGRVLGVSSTDDATTTGDSVITLPYHGNHGTRAKVLNETVEETLARLEGRRDKHENQQGRRGGGGGRSLTRSA